ncbi:putative sterigmatocystin biosynthesis monooxygenase STCB [Cyphellophora attinorum]|uniref:Putative sterigmatocystin biosynthesis monooxygenase STCB n=1 Tax=Cyphellophora attinorum TaxID=1664694 RepID=A0A0N1HLC3_9EURO|nr:putative sterigmatocystin biosynthesis monooxygenase STCB [Phialophora attinorum]KPI35287.1 putative sterigmatocystin biosynthesis monooxygenase STCB [Phialophora attinorum]
MLSMTSIRTDPGILHSLVRAAWILLAASVLRFIYRAQRGPLARLPGPEISKWTGAVMIYHWLTGQGVDYVAHLHDKYGPVVRVTPDHADFADLSALKEIHRVGGRFVKSDFYRRLVPFGTNVFAQTDPRLHASRRRLLASPISDSSLRTFEDVVNARVVFALDQAAGEMRQRGVADMFKWWLFMATDIIGELSFGESFKMLEHGEKNQYSSDLEQLASFQPFRTTFPTLVKLASHLSLPFFGKIAAAGRRIGQYSQASIDRYRALLQRTDEKAPQTLFSKIWADKELTPDDIRSEAQGYIVAGSDTTAVTLTYLVYNVCQDERVRQRLLEELASLPTDFRDADVRNLPYLDQVVTETLRLNAPVAASLERTAPPEGARLAGYDIPGGVIVSTQAYTLHRSKKIFEDPHKFNPDRWRTPSAEMKDSMMPFGGGARRIHLAKMELRLATARFFTRFPATRLSRQDGMSEKDMEQVHFFLMAPRGHRLLVEL